ncbi:SDR family NAD(P)-dependent oxidoreductase [Zavarzinella formosa]|uniref:SDR family NAD(P)-dependent oxidoreductase n=1 Tax=Zavarzinella formosa TaxID=360055 RepID=UPI0002FF043B|nr:SDR family NAD(P)-dependent oxidoreductase [Zavarzinella formosa]
MGRRRDLTGMRVLVTGASQGIGRALAELAAKRGMKVLAAARSIELLNQLAETVRKQGQTLEVVQADVASEEGRNAMVAAAREKFGGLDILINNAGIGATGHFADSEPEVLRRIIETNFFGTVETTRAFLPLLKEGKLPALVNVSSILGKRAIAGRSLYSASKFAVEGWSQAIRAEFARFDIDVITINPGLTQTNFSQNMLEKKGKMQLDHMRGMTSEQVANATLNAIAGGKKIVNLTFKGKVLLFVNRFAPDLIDRISRKKVRGIFAEEIAAREKAR